MRQKEMAIAKPEGYTTLMKITKLSKRSRHFREHVQVPN
jgi:hypothetical protein